MITFACHQCGKQFTLKPELVDAPSVDRAFMLQPGIGYIRVSSFDPQTGKPPEDLEKEIRLLLDGVKTTLSAADLTMDDLVSVQVFCPDLTLYEKFNEIYRTYFIKDFPARAFIGSGPLLRGGRFEMQGVAVRR